MAAAHKCINVLKCVQVKCVQQQQRRSRRSCVASFFAASATAPSTFSMIPTIIHQQGRTPTELPSSRKRRRLVSEEYCSQESGMESVSEDASLSSSSSSASTTSVTFALFDQVQHFESDRELARAQWLTVQDYRHFKRQRQDDAAKISQLEDPRSLDELCFWGLEAMIVQDMKQKISIARKSLRQDVLSEQARSQREEDIARIARQHSNWSAKVAAKKGRYYASQIDKL